MNSLKVEFNVPVTKVEGLTILTKEEARKKMGMPIYEGTSLDTVINLIQEAKDTFMKKVLREDYSIQE